MLPHELEAVKTTLSTAFDPYREALKNGHYEMLPSLKLNALDVLSHASNLPRPTIESDDRKARVSSLTTIKPLPLDQFLKGIDGVKRARIQFMRAVRLSVPEPSLFLAYFELLKALQALPDGHDYNPANSTTKRYVSTDTITIEDLPDAD